MNNLFRIAGALVAVVLFAGAVQAQKEPSKDEWFTQIAKLSNTKKREDQAKAYQQSKDFLAKYGKDTDDKVKKIRDFASKYRLSEFNRALDEVKMSEALEFGEDILADEPENSYVTYSLAFCGFETYTKKQEKGYESKTIAFARQSLAFFEAGKVPKAWEPFKDQAEVTALMHYIIGSLSIEFDMLEAAKSFYRALGYEAQFKKQSYPYYVVATYYEQKYEGAAAEFKKKHGAKREEDAAMKADRDAMNAIVDQMIDWYARAVKLGEAENIPNKDAWNQRLKQIYAFRKGSEAGLSDLLGKVLSTPMTEPF